MKLKLRSGVLLVLLTIMLVGCGKSEAEEDYARCNDEYAAGMECTEEEFRDFLYDEFEISADMIGGVENATAETQTKAIEEINGKIEEIFE